MMAKKHEAASAVVRAMKEARSQVATYNMAELAAHTGLAFNAVKNAIDFLRIHGYVASPRTRQWQLTPRGIRVQEPAGVCYEPNHAHQPSKVTEAHKAGATGLRGAAWRALRIRGAITVAEVCALVVTADSDYGRKPELSVRKYFLHLTDAGVINSSKRANKAGARLYILLKNVGPLAPTASPRGHVYDPNAGAWLLGGPQNVTAGVKAQVAQ